MKASAAALRSVGLLARRGWRGTLAAALAFGVAKVLVLPIPADFPDGISAQEVVVFKRAAIALDGPPGFNIGSSCGFDLEFDERRHRLNVSASRILWNPFGSRPIRSYYPIVFCTEGLGKGRWSIYAVRSWEQDA